MLLEIGAFVAKQASSVLGLSEPALLSNHELTGVFHIFSNYNTLVGLTL